MPSPRRIRGLEREAMTNEEATYWKGAVENLVELRDDGANVTNWEDDFIDSMKDKLDDKPFFITVRQREIVQRILEKYDA